MPKLVIKPLTKRIVEAVKPGAYAWDSEVRGFGVRNKVFVYRFDVLNLEYDKQIAAYEQAKVSGTSLPKPKKRVQRFINLGPFPALTVEQARQLAKTKAALPGVDHRAEFESNAEERRKAKTLGDLEEHYLGTYATARALRASTLRDARGVLRLVTPEIKAKKVEAITKPDVRRLHGEARDAAGKYQANRLLAVLSKMFSLAEEEGWRVALNPCRGVKKFDEDQRSRNLSDTEVARLLDACEGYVGQDPAKGQTAADAVRLLLYTGARLQEVLKAEWVQFDLERGRWEKPSSHTKTKRQHRLDVDGPALDLLRAMRERVPDGRFLFPGEPGTDAHGRPVERPRADLKRPWASIVKEAGLTGVRLHDLRRTMASFMLSGGASLATVGSTLGQTQPSTTARYAHLSQTVQREELRKAGERMLSSLTISRESK